MCTFFSPYSFESKYKFFADIYNFSAKHLKELTNFGILLSNIFVSIAGATGWKAAIAAPALTKAP